MTKRYMKEYGNDILRRKKEMSYSKESLIEMETRINEIIKVYDGGYITITEAMHELIKVDLDLDDNIY